MLIGKGVVTFNIIPDRNWNIPDPDVRRMKVQNLYRVVELAQKLDLPLNIGTEMNSVGQKLADDLNAPELVPLRELFLEGAYFIYGHTTYATGVRTRLPKRMGQSLPPYTPRANAFYTQVGRLIPLGRVGAGRLEQFTSALSPAEILKRLATYS